MSKFVTFALTGLMAAGAAVAADEAPKADGGVSAAQLSQQCRIDIRGDKKEQWMRLPKADSSVTQHHITPGGRAPGLRGARARSPSPSTAARAPPRCGCTWGCSGRSVS
jgi:hypothetical protein